MKFLGFGRVIRSRVRACLGAVASVVSLTMETLGTRRQILKPRRLHTRWRDTTSSQCRYRR